MTAQEPVAVDGSPWRGIAVDTFGAMAMAMALRLTDAETDALRRRAELESRSMQDVARQAVREYVDNHSRAELLDRVLDHELPRYREALDRLSR
ncbi:ribbon-helix-helix protein, CopG family [Georgenia sp. Z1491]|uniref:ribbon-helix-helix protein, CopG family n=1 Tax=Georgenia sp. Z1491 TaxID=3416707 RepID=UPI003CF090CD